MKRHDLNSRIKLKHIFRDHYEKIRKDKTIVIKYKKHVLACLTQMLVDIELNNLKNQ